MRKCIIDALRSDRVAMRLCIERILPPRRDGFVQFSLPAINSITGVVAGYQQLLQSVAAGKLTPEAGVLASELLDKQRHILETLEYDERISQVEAECGLCDKEAA
jgi:hypothetical protein